MNGHYWSSECLQIECELLYSARETHPCIFLSQVERKNQSGEILTIMVKMTRRITVIMTFNVWMPGRSLGSFRLQNLKSVRTFQILYIIIPKSWFVTRSVLYSLKSHYLCTVLLWINGLRKMFKNHWFGDALKWICNDLCVFFCFFPPFKQ